MKKLDLVFLLSLVCYLEHVCVVVMAVLHHHCLVTGQSERDAVLPSAVYSLQQQQQQARGAELIFWNGLSFSSQSTHLSKNMLF